MAGISETIVREYFELHGFFLRQHRKYVATGKRDEDDVDFYIWNPLYQTAKQPLPFVLTAADLAGVARAVVAVKGWHTETFSSSRLENAPSIFRFVEAPVFQQAARAFGEDGPMTKILIVPGLPQEKGARQQSIDLLKNKGIDAVVSFQTMLADLIDKIEVNRNYQKSDLLQIIRILKNYDFFKERQLELFRARSKRRSKK